ASRLGRELAAIPGVRLMAPVEANLAFAAMPEPAIEALAAAGVRFARRGGGVIRLVTRFDGTPAEVDQFIALVRRLIGERSPNQRRASDASRSRRHPSSSVFIDAANEIRTKGES